MRQFWVLAEQKGKRGITARNIESDSPEQAIKDEFGAIVKPASPFKFDFCTQESNENGYRYWILASDSDGATLRSGVSGASDI